MGKRWMPLSFDMRDGVGEEALMRFPRHLQIQDEQSQFLRSP
jgi:hypothetical protein